MRVKTVAMMLLILASLAAQAATSVVIDAKNNCLSAAFGSASGGVPASFQLVPGRYVLSLVANSMSCSNGNLGGGCNITSVMAQGGYGVGRWGVAVTEPMILDVPSTTSTLYAYVSDNYCQDSTGQASLLIQAAN